jgi:hypothetical protein
VLCKGKTVAPVCAQDHLDAGEITVEEIAELSAIFGKDGEMAAERLS